MSEKPCMPQKRQDGGLLERRRDTQRATAIQRRFIKQYVGKKVYMPYVNGCGLSIIGSLDKSAAPEEKKDFCIIVRLVKPLPRELKLPRRFEGMRVIVKPLGVIRAFCGHPG